MARQFRSFSCPLLCLPGRNGDWRITASCRSRSGRRRSTVLRRRHQARAGGRRGDRPDERDPRGAGRSAEARLQLKFFSPLLLAMAPLGAQAADLVVWWEKGYYAAGGRGGPGDRRRLRARDRQAGRARLSIQSRSFRRRSSGAGGRAATRLRLRLGFDRYFGQWALEDRLVDLSDAIGPFADLFDPDVLGSPRYSTARPASAALYALPMGHYDQLRPRLEEPSGARGLHARRHPEGVGGVLVLLVRPGAAGGAQGFGPRRRLGCRPAHVGRHATPETSSSSSWPPTRRLRDPRWPARHRRPRDPAQARSRRSTAIPRSTARAARRPTRSNWDPRATTRRSSHRRW